MIRLFENDFFNYLGLVVVGSGFLWCVLRLALRGVRHDIARAVLLASLVLAAVAPLASAAVYPAPPVVAATQVAYDATQEYIATEIPAEVLAGRSWTTSILYIIYSIVTIALLWRMVWNVVKIKRLGRPDANSMVVSEAVERPFTFLSTIYVGVADAGESMIVSHERAHARLHHSWDRLFVEAVAALFWINPFVYLLRRDLREVHEFQADEAVTREGYDRESYKTLIFSRMLGTSPEIAGGLAYILTKKRIAMISQTQTRGWKRSLLLLPAVAALIATVTFTTKTASAQEPTAKIQSEKTTKIYVNGKLYTGKLNDIAPQSIKSITVTKEGIQIMLLTEADKEAKGTITLRKNNEKESIPFTLFVDGKEFKSSINQIDPRTIKSISRNTSERILHIKLKAPEEMKESSDTASNRFTDLSLSAASADSIGTRENPVLFSETMPTFQGQDGKSSFSTWIASQVKYPKDKTIDGNLVVSFVITDAGKLTNAKIVRSLDPEIDQQVLDLMKNSPEEWTVGLNKGKPVNVKFMMMITFSSK